MSNDITDGCGFDIEINRNNSLIFGGAITAVIGALVYKTSSTISASLYSDNSGIRDTFLIDGLHNLSPFVAGVGAIVCLAGVYGKVRNHYNENE